MQEGYADEEHRCYQLQHTDWQRNSRGFLLVAMTSISRSHEQIKVIQT